MYTSGWPKNQNTFCHSRALPPREGSKNTVPRCRSANSMMRPAVRTGVASTTKREVARTLQQKAGMRSMVIPGARIRRIVTMKLIPPRIEAVPTIASPTIQRSWPLPPCTDRGAKLVQPAAAAPPLTRNPERTVSPPTGSSQNDNAFTRGKAMSRAPICNGTK